MTKDEKERLKASIVKAKDALEKGLLLPEDAAQLYRMIDYYEERMIETMNLIKIFNGNSTSVEVEANEWLKANPSVSVKSASIHEMHDNYTYGECAICNQWESLILVCEGGEPDEQN